MVPQPRSTPSSPAKAAEQPQRFGIRARLLALLLPGIGALLALDSWNDYRALTESLVVAYDQSLLEPVQALANGIVVASDGSVRVQEPFSIQAMFDSTRLRYKYLHVGVQRIPKGGTLDVNSPETTLMGVPGLPRPAQRPPDGTPVFYDAVHEQHPVRVAALRQTVYDTVHPGVAYSVLIQAAEGTGPRTEAQAETLRQELLRDTRTVLVMALLVWLGVAWTLRPLERLRRSLRERPRDDLTPLDAGGVPREVAPLVDAVNHHIAGHRRMVAEQSQFLADASHQLRTPLSILSIQAGYAVRETDPARMRESLHAIVAQLARTRRLSEQLLALAHATTESEAAPAEPRWPTSTPSRARWCCNTCRSHARTTRTSAGSMRAATSAMETTPTEPTKQVKEKTHSCCPSPPMPPSCTRCSPTSCTTPSSTRRAAATSR